MYAQSCLTFCIPMDCVAHQAPLSMELSRQEYWSGSPFPAPGDHANPGMESLSLASPTLAGWFFTTAPPGKHHGQCRKELVASLNASIPNWLLAQFSSVWSLSRVRLFATPWIAAGQASLSITNSQSLLKLMYIELVMPSSHFILCRPLLLLPPVPASIRVFSNETALHMRWPKYWSFSFSSWLGYGKLHFQRVLSVPRTNSGLLCFNCWCKRYILSFPSESLELDFMPGRGCLHN